MKVEAAPKPATHLPTYSGLAGCYDISQTALVKMGRKYRLSLEDLTNPEIVYKTLMKHGDRRGVLVRRLSNPKIMEDILVSIIELEYFPV